MTSREPLHRSWEHEWPVPPLQLPPSALSGTPRMRSCGRPIPGVELKVVDESGRELPTGDVGEIVCRWCQNMKGYWKLPKEMAQTIRGGWLHTGDAG